MTEDARQKKDDGKVGTLAAILSLGHEAFQKGGIDAVSAFIVNNSRLLADYDRSCLVRWTDGVPAITAVSGQSVPNRESEYSKNIVSVVAAFARISSPERVSMESLEKQGAPEAARAAFQNLKNSPSGELMLFPMPPPSRQAAGTDFFVWAVEFFGAPSENSMPVLALLSRHYAEALWHYSERIPQFSLKNILREKGFTHAKIAAASSLLTVLLLFGIRLSDTANADFEIIPFKERIEHAPFSGVLGECFKADGEAVGKDDLILVYRTEDLAFNLALAKNNFDEVSAELDLARQKSFSDSLELEKIRLLELRLEKEKVEVEKFAWFLSRSRMKAGMDGILVMDEMQKMAGRHVQAGEKLFEIISPEGLLAEIRLDETRATILNSSPTAVLFLYARPESPLSGKIVSVSPKPVQIEETGRFAYLLRMEISHGAPALICGMRGIAKVKGHKVSLAYCIFRGIVLWWRNI